ncbi:hypothetical protein [Arthrobacter sp. H5]|uniref:hypothetical protein n=1 Tax=Arthrobacter sp. H5 TaxID=1267973 RepID=UPI001C1DD33B|nr:hypothetical protein [Arthrobacter sp. H5]
MSSSAASHALAPVGFQPPGAHGVLSTVGRKTDLHADLQAKINHMQASRLCSTRIPTVPALARILPGGGLQAGGAYSVNDSTTLAMALLAGPSRAGAWCSVIGMPSFSVEAAAGFGIELERLILVPHPGDQWLTVTAAMVDVVSIILTRAPAHLTPSDTSRLRARLRQRGAALIAVGPWPQSEATLSVTGSSWEGLGAGTGHLRTRRMRVSASSQNGRPRTADLWLPDLQRGPWAETASKEDVGQQEFFPLAASAS